MSNNKTGKSHVGGVSSVSIDLGCSLSCLKPKKLLSAVFCPKAPRPHPRSASHNHNRRRHHHHRSNCSPFLSRSFSSSTSSRHNLAAATASATTATATASSSFSPPPQGSSSSDYTYYYNSLQYLLESEADRDSKPVKGFGKIDDEGVAVEKDSRDPYLDFRHSMLQMIIENEIYNREDLRELLGCFLQLNSPCYHGVIIRAFTEIWNGAYNVGSGFNSPNNS
ncbi:hypothetical protein MLD38_020305 [Melastoma candidum]|uniref:Uncharacterized protein n=1 Tax=Melastoma candidum TaxID=119954 RepID=A0ACB9QFJ0_9MYRT|nr:hypothetical protein MLD38_020305 [Melastoma candidum]